MAHVYRPNYSRTIPANASITCKRRGRDKGKRFASFPDGKGRRVTRPLTRNGAKMLVPSPRWHIRYYLPDGTRKHATGYKDRKATEALATELERRAERQDAGLSDATDDHARTPLAKHAADYRCYLEGKGNTAEYVAKTLARLTAVLEGCGFLYLADFQPSRLTAFLADLRRSGKGITTANYYLAAAKGFTRWLWKDRRSPADALAGVARLANAATDVRHPRRDFAPEELRLLLHAARNSTKAFRRLSGADRYHLYLAAAASGFRASELASMTPESFNLAVDSPEARVDAGYAKNRKEAVQPLPRDVAEVLRGYLAGKARSEPIWPGTWKSQAFLMIQADLRAAREKWLADAPDDRQRLEREASDVLTYIDADGRYADFHALRHSYITAIGRSGASPKVHQDLARHSTYTLTGRYTHARFHDLAAVVDAMPSILGTTAERAREDVAATGTDGKLPERPLCLPLCLDGDVSGALVIRGETTARESQNATNLQLSHENKPLSGESEVFEGSYPAWIRTRNEGTKIPRCLHRTCRAARGCSDSV